MNILEDPVFKTNYQKYKFRVKRWESEFTEKHGRKPDKNDIKEADMKIKESYKMYWKLKTRALEETLIDITFCDEVPETVTNETPTKTTIEEPTVGEEIKEGIRQINDNLKKDTENIDPHPKDMNTVTKCPTPMDDNTETKQVPPLDVHAMTKIVPPTNDLKVDEPEQKNVKGVWGDHLSKSNERVPKKNLLLGRSSSFQLSQNKFTNSALTKRNPRKSLSSSKLRHKSDRSTNVTTVDQTDVNIKDGYDVKEEAKPIFGDTVKITYTEAKPNSQSINTVQQLIEGHTIINRHLNPGWLDRCSKQSNLEYPIIDSQRLSGTSDSGIECMESSIQSPKENIPQKEPPKSIQISDEEDFICNSDTEEERRNKRIRNFKKRLSDQDSHASKRQCIESNSVILTMPVSTETSTEIANSTANINASTNQLRNINIKDIHHSSTSTDMTQNNNMNSNINIVTNLASEPDKCIDHKEDISKNTKNGDALIENSDPVATEKPVRRRVVRRRIKHISSDDSDPDFTEDKVKTTKKKETKTPRAPSTRKTKTTGENTKEIVQPSKARTKRSSKAKKNTDVDESDQESTKAKDKEPAIYGVETFKTVPRFAMRAGTEGDLIQQFANSIAATTENSSSSATVIKTKGQLTDKEKLEKKVADGKINENFVRINLKKKVFVRGKKNFNFSKYKKNQWKQRKKELGSSSGSLDVADLAEKNGVSTCFKCGEIGHYSRYCPNQKGDDLIPLEEVDESSQYPTLEEAQMMASQNARAAHSGRINRLPEKPSYSAAAETDSTETVVEYPKENNDDEDLWEPIDDEELLCGHKIPDDLVTKLLPPEIGAVPPLYGLREDQSLIDTPPEVFNALRMFGHESFRSGQEKAVMRILSGQSTLITLSTGSGKSLCYQLPAYLYSKHSNCITLVISPLVSLMDDQVTGVPHFLSAACLHTNQTPKVKDTVMQMVKQGKLNILLVSPEAVVAGEKSTGFGALLRQLPPIAFACIDEAHCISQWSHNFRPSYLMISRVLKEKLGVKTVLALTATATKATAESIVRHLGIHDGLAGVISDIPMPRNLILTVSKDEDRDQALVRLLQSERFVECNSIIVYCTRREECARIAGVLRVSLQDGYSAEKLNGKLSAIAETYHAGLSAHRRKIVQKAFMNGQTRIVVATVAFGMGLNKPDIRAVIHYNMPGTFESYVQEVGRAGRDGLRAHCHLFLSSTEDSDKWELRRHIYANGVDRHAIRRLLQKVFVPCSCATRSNMTSRCPGHEVAIPVDETVAALDLSEETISTLLCYLELHPKRFITLLSSVYVRAKVSSYAGPLALKLAAQSSPPLAMAIALDLQKGISHETSNCIEFPVVDVASAIGWDSGVVKSHLKSLEWKTGDGQPKRSPISVRYDRLGLRVKAPGDLTDLELDEALDALFSRTQSQESSALLQLETICKALHDISVRTVRECLVLTEDITAKSDQLKQVIRNYFEGKELMDIDLKKQEKLVNEAEVAGDVRALILSYRDNNFTGRAVARIFHGIQSPNYPAYVWGKCRFWRAHLRSNFNAICQIATKEILSLR